MISVNLLVFVNYIPDKSAISGNRGTFVKNIRNANNINF